MKINVDFSGAEEMVKFINYTTQSGELNLNNLRSTLVHTQGYRMFFKFYKKQNFIEDYIDMIIKTYENQDYATDNDVLQKMHLAYKKAFNKPDYLYDKLKVVECINFYSLGKRLQECLPSNTELSMEVYFILDGYNAGSIVDEYTICLDLLLWPVEIELSRQMEGIILHEFHHIGAIYWLKKDVKREELIEQKNGKGLFVYLMNSILGEGSAFYFFNDNLNMNGLFKELYGEELVQTYEINYNESWRNMDIKIKELDEFLIKLWKSNEYEYNELRVETTYYNFAIDNNEALDKVIGSYMCSIIDMAFGKQEILNIIKELRIFPQVYNSACLKLNKNVKFSNELINLWNDIWY